MPGAFAAPTPQGSPLMSDGLVPGNTWYGVERRTSTSAKCDREKLPSIGRVSLQVMDNVPMGTDGGMVLHAAPLAPAHNLSLKTECPYR